MRGSGDTPNRRAVIRTIAGLPVALALTDVARAQRSEARKPRLPPGRDPGGVPVAVLGAGVDYQRPSIAERLARDGEGEAIAWDAIDGDALPFEDAGTHRGRSAPGEAGTAMVLRLLSEAPRVRLIPVRVPENDLASGLAFALRTPARIIVALASGDRQHPRGPFHGLTRGAAQRLVIAPASVADKAAQGPETPAPGNLLVVTACLPDGAIHPRLADRSAFDLAVPAAYGLASKEDFDEASAARLVNAAAIRVAALGARLSALAGAASGPELKAVILSHARPYASVHGGRPGTAWLPDIERLPPAGR
jgi:subtilisin family serine protease